MKLITNFLSIQSQLKVLHWQTKSYAEHKAFGKLYDALDGLFDTFIEVYMGKYGTILAKEEFEFEVQNYSEEFAREFLDKTISYFTEDITNGLDEKDTDLLNLRDEVIAEMNKTKYLLKLK
jgi:DNA-binding ferritin-like protein